MSLPKNYNITPHIGGSKAYEIKGNNSPDGRFHPLDVAEFNANETKKKSYGEELRQ
jgi:protein associated with RNAse G/E